VAICFKFLTFRRSKHLSSPPPHHTPSNRLKRC
jgi:hypothetical protein